MFRHGGIASDSRKEKFGRHGPDAVHRLVYGRYGRPHEFHPVEVIKANEGKLVRDLKVQVRDGLHDPVGHGSVGREDCRRPVRGLKELSSLLACGLRRVGSDTADEARVHGNAGVTVGIKVPLQPLPAGIQGFPGDGRVGGLIDEVVEGSIADLLKLGDNSDPPVSSFQQMIDCFAGGSSVVDCH
jgi:hypothetical protein